MCGEMGFLMGDGDLRFCAKSLTRKTAKKQKAFAEYKFKSGKGLQCGLHVCSILPAQNSARKKTRKIAQLSVFLRINTAKRWKWRGCGFSAGKMRSLRKRCDEEKQGF